MKEKAIVFGAGKYAEANWERILELFDVIGFADNNERLWGAEKFGLPIRRFDPPKGGAVVIAVCERHAEILNQIAGMCAETAIYAVINDRIYRCGKTADDILLLPPPPANLAPTILQLEVSQKCNVACRYCPFHGEGYHYHGAHRGFMSMDTADEICRQITAAETLQELMFCGMGESFLNPLWPEIANKVFAANHGIRKFRVYTNGMALTKETAEKLNGLRCAKKRIVVSIDGCSSEESAYWRRGTDIRQVIQNVRTAYETVDPACVEFVVSNVCVLPKSTNANDCADVQAALDGSKAWLQEAFPFASVQPRLACTYGTPARHLTFPVPHVKITDARVAPKLASCSPPFRMVCVSAEGDIFSCPCADVAANEKISIIGHISRDDIFSVWQTDEILNGIRDYFKAGKKPPCCGNCPQLGGDTARCLQRTEDDAFYTAHR